MSGANQVLAPRHDGDATMKVDGIGLRRAPPSTGEDRP